MHQQTATYYPQQLNFRRWSRKGYAVFASLGRLVRIATLKTVVSGVLSSKSEVNKSLALLPFTFSDDDEDNAEHLDQLLGNPILLQLTALNSVSNPSNGIAAPACLLTILNPIGFGRWGFLLRKTAILTKGPSVGPNNRPITNLRCTLPRKPLQT
jgi:hypothetical protein